MTFIIIGIIVCSIASALIIGEIRANAWNKYLMNHMDAYKTSKRGKNRIIFRHTWKKSLLVIFCIFSLLLLAIFFSHHI